MKRINFYFISFLCLITFSLVTSTPSFAENIKGVETELGIEIDTFNLEQEIKSPLIDGGDNKKNYYLLPKTGELLSSLIIILLGISLLIFSLGVMSIKQLYQITEWEG